MRPVRALKAGGQGLEVGHHQSLLQKLGRRRLVARGRRPTSPARRGAPRVVEEVFRNQSGNRVLRGGPRLDEVLPIVNSLSLIHI